MLNHSEFTIAAEKREFPEWHHGRKSYGVWVLRCDNDLDIVDKFIAAREHLSEFIIAPYNRQPHITLFVCGFLVDTAQYNDDFTHEQLEEQLRIMENSGVHPFEIEIGGLTSFASAPFLDVQDLDGGIYHVREILSQRAPEFRTTAYHPHLTVGLYEKTFHSLQVLGRMEEFSSDPIRWKVEQITFATYRANEFAGKLDYGFEIPLKSTT